MDHKKNAQRRQKRQSKGMEVGNYWDCSVCTYRNTAEAFKCAMCDVRKGTSTRKPRLNPQLVAQQVAQQLNATSTTPKPKREGSKERKQPSSASNVAISLGRPNVENSSSLPIDGKLPKKKKIRNIRPRLKNVDRSQVHRQPVTVNNVTVVITEFLPKSTSTFSSKSHVANAAGVPNSSGLSNRTLSLNGDVATSSS